MADLNGDLLWFGLQEISTETVAQLGERAHCFVDLYNDWLDISSSFSSAYSGDTALASLVAADFFSLGKDLCWLHRLLHWGNYPLMARVLRYNWELMFRAYFADCYQPNVPGDIDIPGQSIDEKVHWLESRARGLHFRTLIVPILNVLLPGSERGRYGRIWRSLNEHVHPTRSLRWRTIDESALMVRDAFDKNWALATIDAACDVYDLIWLVTLKRFPSCLPQLAGPRLFKYTVSTATLVASHNGHESVTYPPTDA